MIPLPAKKGFSVRIFLPDGDPDGLKVIEKSNWTGRGLVFPRSLFAQAKSRPEMEGAGVYALVGSADESPLRKVYIGEADLVRPRLEHHASGKDSKDFWTHAVVFTSKDQNLNKAHVRWLESRLIHLAADSKRCMLQNGNASHPSSLSEADTADAQAFLDDMLLCLPILGYGFFEAAPPAPAPAHQFFLKVKGADGQGFESPQGFIVLKGSRAIRQVTKVIPDYIRDMREALIQQGILTDRGDHYELSQDYPFSSPSMASGVLRGCTSNGRLDWRTADGKTLKSVQEAAASS